MNITPRQIIAALDGPTAMAKLLNDDGHSDFDFTAARVGNWARNGFPARVQLDHAALLRKGEVKARRIQAKERKGE